MSIRTMPQAAYPRTDDRLHIRRLYEEQGYIGPLTAFPEGEMRDIANAVRREFDARGAALPVRRNRHLDWEPARRLATHSSIVEAVRAILGDDLVLWRTHFFIGRKGAGLGWHQDEYHTLLDDPLQHLTVHLAVTPATPDNCVTVLPGSHRLSREDLAQRGFHFVPGTDDDGYGAPNYWRSEGRSLAPVRMALRPGQFFIFHPSMVHASLDRTTPEAAKPRQRSRLGRLAAAVARRLGAADDLRLAIGLRIAPATNRVRPAAFAETLPRQDHCVPLHGSAPANDDTMRDRAVLQA